MVDEHKITGNVVVITGATRGIGYAIAEELEKENIVVSIGRKKHKKEAPGIFLRCDVTDENEVKRCINEIIQRFNKIDVLINSAGVMFFNELINVSDKEFDETFSVNVKGVFLMCKEVLPYMRRQREGYIINISSVRGITSAPGKGIYSASKFAVRALTETILLENRDYNIKATSICPGVIWTESTKERLQREGLTKEDVLLEEDIVKTVKYLLSLSAKAYVRELVIGGRLHG